MIRRALMVVAGLAIASAPVAAQLISPLEAPGSAEAVAAQIQASVPPTCSAMPAPDTLAGTRGTAAPCVPRSDAARPTPVQAVNASTTDANGAWSVTFARPFASSTPVVSVTPVVPSGSSLPYECAVTSTSATAAAGHCWAATSQSWTIQVGVNLTANPYANRVPVGTRVMIVAREPTQ